VRAREGLLVLLLVAAATAAALTFRTAVHPELVENPRHHGRFAESCAALPALGAIRVRTDIPDALPRIPGRVSAPSRATALFRSGRYLQASPAEIADVLARLERGELPPPPPAAPDLSRYYRDAAGPYTCDVLSATPAALRAALPDARLSGEPVAREAEEREAPALVRAALLALAVLGAWLAWRCGLSEAERRLLAALLGLVAVGLLGLGIDRWSLAALLLVAAAPSGTPLVAALPCVFFPSVALQRLGIILSLGGILRLRRPEGRGSRRARLLALGLSLAGLVAARILPVDAYPRPEVATEPGALLVAHDAVAKEAARLRSEGHEVVGDERLVPLGADVDTRRALRRVFERATRLAGKAEGEARRRFEDVANAAERFDLYLPADLRARLHTLDGRAVLWVPADAQRDDLASARLYRVRGDLELREGARLAGVLVFALGSAFAAARALLARLLGAALGSALLFVASPEAADVYIPLAVLSAAAPAAGTALALAAAAFLCPAAYAWPAVALALASAVPAFSLRSPRRPSPPPSRA
jgi:hypothetical protein